MNYFGFCKGIKSLNLPNAIELDDVYKGYFSRFYAESMDRETYDIPLYLELAKKYGGNILELACGSGRVALPLLHNNFKVTAVDNSEDMLKILKEKARIYPDKIEVHCCNMSDYDKQVKYDVVIIAAGSICLLRDQNERVKLINHIYENLVRDGGVFIFDVIEYDTEDFCGKNMHFFNKKEKAFVMLFNKFNEENREVMLNAYAESVNEFGEVTRYLGYSKKSMISSDDVTEIIRQSNFNLIDMKKFKVDGGKLKFYTLKK